jgi:membrane associated rhomboid family serine protease
VIPIKDNMPTDRFPVVTLTLIIVNVIAYLLAIRHGGSIWSGPSGSEVVKYGAIPYELTHGGRHCAEFVRQTAFGQQLAGTFCDGQTLPDHTIAHVGGQGRIPTFETVLTSMFMHASIIHLAGNMLFLWIFGGNIEDSMGRVKFVLFYLLGGVAALALQVVVDPDSVAPTIGASGAIAAVLGGYLLLYPKARVLTLVFIILFVTVIELPAIVMLGIWFAEQAVFGAVGLTNPTGGGGGVAYFAHVGGFAFGVATIKLLATRRKAAPAPRPVYQR